MQRREVWKKEVSRKGTPKARLNRAQRTQRTVECEERQRRKKRQSSVFNNNSKSDRRPNIRLHQLEDAEHIPPTQQEWKRLSVVHSQKSAQRLCTVHLWLHALHEHTEREERNDRVRREEANNAFSRRKEKKQNCMHSPDYRHGRPL